MARVRVNISGNQFEFNSDIMMPVVQKGRLKEIVKKALEDEKELSFTVDRSAESFAAVLMFYETGKLHLPTTVCPRLFLDELDYWGISHENLSDCCYYRLHTFLDEMETRQNFKKDNLTLEQTYIVPSSTSPCPGLLKYRQKVWTIVDFQENTICAKLYYLLVIFMIMLSIFTLAISTEPNMQRSLTQCEILEYLEHSDDPDLQYVKIYFGDLDCSNFHDSSDSFEDIFEEGIEVEVNGENMTIVLDKLTVPSNAFSVFEIVFVVFFSIDIALRMFSCPSILRYSMNALNIIDLLALLTSYVLLIVVYVEKEHQYKESWLHILKYFQVLRALRLLRVVKTFRASQVLAYSLRENIKDLFILGLFLFLGISTFSCLIYFAESRDTVASIPVGWYWAIITLTTVGYGDITPKTAIGRAVASLCAVLGVVLMAVTVPIFVNNFLSLYQFALVDDYVKKKRKEDKGKRDENGKACSGEIDAVEGQGDLAKDTTKCNDVVYDMVGKDVNTSEANEAWT